LIELGIQPGAILLVHSSLTSLGWVAGGPVAVVQALIDTLGPQGTLVMPAFTGDLTDPQDWHDPPVPEERWPAIRAEMPAFDPASSPGRKTGAIAECLRTWPGTRRSDHPNMSFAALGARAAAIVEDHALDFGFGDTSPLARLYAMEAFVLLLGVGFDRATCFHLAEARWPGTLETTAKAPVLREGKRVWASFLDHLYNDRDFAEIGRDFEAAYPVARGAVGAAEAKLFPLAPAVDFALAWMKDRRKISRTPL
jgi:aminoglycoside 3-N-acetyltransferase